MRLSESPLARKVVAARLLRHMVESDRPIDSPRGICQSRKTEQCTRRGNCSFLTFLTRRRRRYRKVARVESTITRGTDRRRPNTGSAAKLRPKHVTSRNAAHRGPNSFLRFARTRDIPENRENERPAS